MIRKAKSTYYQLSLSVPSSCNTEIWNTIKNSSRSHFPSQISQTTGHFTDRSSMIEAFNHLINLAPDSSVNAHICPVEGARNASTSPLEAHLLCLSAPLICPHLAHIFNQTFVTGMIHGKPPQLYRYTSGDVSDLNSYRPIYRLPFLAKLLESLVNLQLRSCIDSLNILQQQQSGFCPGHSTITAVVSVIDNIVSYLD